MTYFFLGPLNGHSYLRKGLETTASGRGFRIVTHLDMLVVKPDDRAIAVSDLVEQLMAVEKVEAKEKVIIFVGQLGETVVNHGWEWISPDSLAPPAQLLSYLLGRVRLKQIGVVG